MLPQLWEDWYDLVFALASHAVGRYGIEVVKEWRFEVVRAGRFVLYTAFFARVLPNVAKQCCYWASQWNEFWGMPFNGNKTDYSPYMRLYNASAHAVKNAHPQLRVGGPSSNGAVCCIKTFIDVANNMSAPFDFVSGVSVALAPMQLPPLLQLDKQWED